MFRKVICKATRKPYLLRGIALPTAVLTVLIAIAAQAQMPAFAFANPVKTQTQWEPKVYANFKHDRSQPLRNIPSSSVQLPTPQTMPSHPWTSYRGLNHGVDPLIQTAVSSAMSASLVFDFDGIENTGFMPPDPNGSVGSTQFVEWVNIAFEVFDKTTGALVQGPTAAATLWSGFGGPCEVDYRGDPIVVYDKAAERWVMTEIAGFDVNGNADYQCIAVSTSSDATGSYNRYAFSFGGQLVDFTKIAVWPDAYYMTFNRGSQDVCALDRSKMLSGENASVQCFSSNHRGSLLLPADLDGSVPPPMGSPNYLLDADVHGTALNLWRFHVDFATPSNSTLTGPVAITVAPFSAACATCVPQLGTPQLLEANLGLLNHRLAYRNFGTFESLVTDHAVDNGLGQASIRWYELRNPGGNPPTVYQQSTYAPDSLHRWMSSIAMDRAGDIAVGYSVSSPTMNPGIRFTGRLPTDPLSTLEGETTIVDGTGSQTGSGRWGDYSSMSIDPVDDCTFWYTTEYLQENGESWHTRIANFRFPNCGAGFPSKTVLVSSPTPSVFGQAITITATVSSLSGTPTGTVVFLDGPAALGSATLVSKKASLSVSTLVVGSHSIRAVYQGSVKFNPSDSTAHNQAVKMATTTSSLASSQNPAVVTESVTYTATVASQYGGAAMGTVAFQDGGTTIATVTAAGNMAACSTKYGTTGSHSIAATYSGDANNLGNVSSVMTEQINRGFPSKTVLTTSGSPSFVGQQVTFTATVTSINGTIPDGEPVTFYDFATAIGTGTTASGVASFSTSSLTGKTHAIKAAYPGDATFRTSTGLFKQIVQKYPTTTTLTSNPNRSQFGQTVTFTATVRSTGPSAPTSPVKFLEGAITLVTATLNSSVAKFTKSGLAVGTHSITAEYTGDAFNAPSTSSAVNQVVK